MGFFTDLKQDLSQAVDEMADGENKENADTSELQNENADIEDTSVASEQNTEQQSNIDDVDLAAMLDKVAGNGEAVDSALDEEKNEDSPDIPSEVMGDGMGVTQRVIDHHGSRGGIGVGILGVKIGRIHRIATGWQVQTGIHLGGCRRFPCHRGDLQGRGRIQTDRLGSTIFVDLIHLQVLALSRGHVAGVIYLKCASPRVGSLLAGELAGGDKETFALDGQVQRIVGGL